MQRSSLVILCIALFFNGCYAFKHHRTLRPSSNDLDVVKQLAKKYQYVGVLIAELPQELNDIQQKQLRKLTRPQEKLTPYEEYVFNFNISKYIGAFANQNRRFYSEKSSEIMIDYIKGKYKGHKVHVYLTRNYTAGISYMSSYLFLFEYKNRINLVIHEGVFRRRYYHVIKSGLYIQPWVGRSYSRAIDQDIDLYLENLLHKSRRIF